MTGKIKIKNQHSSTAWQGLTEHVCQIFQGLPPKNGMDIGCLEYQIWGGVLDSQPVGQSATEPCYRIFGGSFTSLRLWSSNKRLRT